MVEAAGVETGKALPSNWLMVNDFWSKVLILRRFHLFVDSPSVIPSCLHSACVLETFWRRLVEQAGTRAQRDEGIKTVASVELQRRCGSQLSGHPLGPTGAASRAYLTPIETASTDWRAQ